MRGVATLGIVAALPARVVAVLRDHRRQCGLATFGEGDVHGQQLAQEQVGAPAVVHVMLFNVDEYRVERRRFLGTALQQGQMHQRQARQIEAVGHVRVDPRRQLSIGRIRRQHFMN